MQRLLITGGTGYLGHTLVQQSVEQGWQVAASYFSQSPLLDAGIIWLPLDVRDGLAVEETLDAFKPDVVIHTAFRQNDPDLLAVTAEGAGTVARVARMLGARLIHLSSDVIFDGERQGAYTETDAPNPITAYGIAKAEAERLVQAEYPDAMLVRTSLTYGFDPIDRHTQFVLDICDGRTSAQLFTDEIRCPIFVGDLAAALLELARLDMTGVINIVGTDCLSRYAFGVLLAQAYGRDPARIPAGQSITSSQRRPRNCALDIHMACQMLQTRLRGVREVLATISWS